MGRLESALLDLLVADADSTFVESLGETLEKKSGVATVETDSAADSLVAHSREMGADGIVIGDTVERVGETIEEITTQTDLPVILLSDPSNEETMDDAVAAGVTDVYPRVDSRAQLELLTGRIADANEAERNAPSVIDPADERAYSELFENVSDGLVVHDPDTGEILDVNGRFCEMNGYERDELVGEHVGIVTAQDEEYSYDAALDRIEQVRTEGPQLIEWRNQRKDGETFPAEVHLAAVHIDGQERVLASVRDITERKEREQKLRESERRFELIAEHIDEIIYLSSADFSEILYINPAYEEIYGRPVDDLYENPQSFVEAAHPDDRDRYERDIEQIVEDIETGDPDDMYQEQYRLRRDDEIRWVTVARFPVENADGTVDRIVGRVEDITERKRREREYEQIFNGVQDAIVIHDPETADIVEVNDTFCELMGYNREEILDLGTGGFSVAEEGYTQDRAEEVIAEVRDQGDFGPFEWKVETKDGDYRVLEVVATMAEIGGKPRHVSINRDVTERKRREREFEQIFNSVPAMISVHDPATGEMIDINDTYTEISGYEREMIFELGIEGISVTEDGFTRERANEIIERATETGQSETYEWQIETVDGERRWVEGVATKTTIGGEDRVLAINQDITERRRREREFEAIFNGVHDQIGVFDPETYELVSVNDRMVEVTGYDRERILEERNLISATDEGYDYSRAKELIDEVADTGEPKEFDWHVDTADGDHRIQDVRMTQVTIGGEDRVVTVSRDVTERRRRQQEFEEIFNGVQDPIAVYDPDSLDLLDANEAFLDLLGEGDIERLREQGLEEYMLTEKGFTVERGKEIHQQVVESGVPEMLDWQARTSDGDRLWLEVKITPAVIGGEEVTIASHRDVTERKRRERIIRSLHDATDQLQEAETREAVCEATVTAVETALNRSLAACWLPDDEDTLRPVAATTEFWKVTGKDTAFEAGSFEHDVYEADELVEYEPHEQDEQPPMQEGFLIPLGDHGLLGVGSPAGETHEDVTLDAARILARHARSALDRVERARELRKSERRFRTIAERVDEIIYLVDTDTMEVLYLSPGHREVWGRSLEEVYDDPTAFTDAIHPDDIESFEADRQAMFEEIEAGDPDDSYEFSYRIERPDGELRWIETTGYPIVDEDDRPDRYVAMVKDVTEQHRREQTLETFHEATRDLTAAESRREACQRAIDAAEDVLGFPLVSIYLYDEETGELTPRAITSRLQELDVEPPTFGPGESLPWQVFVQNESTTSSEGASNIYGPRISGPDIVLPLGSHGVMLVGDPTDSFDSEDIELAQILAATLEAALNHVAGERTLEERNEELQRQQERAERLEQLNAIIRDIEQATVEQSSRSGIEEAVCERLTDVDAHDLVWIAEPAVGDGELIPQTRAGTKESYVDAIVDVIKDEGGGHPAVEAYRGDEPRVIENVATEVPANEWRETALQHGIQSIVSLPIRYESKTHGVLTVTSAEPGTFDVAIQEVLSELGRSIGYAITIAEREHALESEGTTELEFTIRDAGLFLVRASSMASCRLQLQRTIRRSGGSFSAFYLIEGADVNDIVDLANGSPGIETAQIVSANDTGDEGLIEVTAPTWFGSAFTERGAVVREASSEAGEGTLVVETPRGTDVRALVEAFQERYPDTEFTAQHQRDRSISSLFELQDVLRDELTDRQWEALETAYSAGYFDWPREVKSEEAADLLDVSQPTFNKHLRIAEKRAFEMLLDREYPE